jgi:hypothetical protein
LAAVGFTAAGLREKLCRIVGSGNQALNLNYHPVAQGNIERLMQLRTETGDMLQAAW